MIKMSSLKSRVKKLTVVSTLLMTSIFLPFLMNISMPAPRLGEDKVNNYEDIEDNLIVSALGTHSWWDKSFHSRQVINITNPNSETLYDYGVEITFNYSTLVSEANMRADLGDLRIIEYDAGGDPFQRKYYFQKDYPVSDIVTVWFETNVTVTGGNSQLDTYLYYGNDGANINTTTFMNETTSGSVASNFGWIRNGNFEQDPQNEDGWGNQTIDGVFGWYYADDVPKDVNSNIDYSPDTPDNINYQHNLSIIASNQELKNEGSYTFKFGDKSHDISSGGGGKDLAGTLFSAPFVVPTVSGGSNKIYINAWRNIRTWDTKNAAQIGVYVRISTTYSSTSVNLHQALGGDPYSQGYVEYWDSLPGSSPVNTVEDYYSSLPNQNTAAGDLTGDLLIDVTDYQGEAIFLEFGMIDYGRVEQANKFNAFFQVDNVTFTYNLDVYLDPEAERRKSDVTIIVRDVDGRIVPNAEVSLINSSKPVADQIRYGPTNSSEVNGSVTFSGVIYSTYNYTVKYKIPSTGYEFVVFNSSSFPLVNFTITESQHTFIIYVDIWTIDFEIVDYDKEPLNYGYVAVYNNTQNGVNLENVTLNADGKGTFRWRNQSSYYYKVYYGNVDYNLNPTLLNASWIKRENYNRIGDKIRQHSVLLNTTIPKAAPTFTVNETFYTNGSQSELGNRMINSAKINITAPRATTTVTSVSVYYIDKNGYSDDNYRIYYNNTAGADLYSINIDMRNPPLTPTTLEGDKYGVYGLRVIASGTNTSLIWGYLSVTLFETTNIYNVTDMCKLNIRVVNEAGGGLVGATVIVNSSIGGQAFFVNLTAGYNAVDHLNGYSYGTTNNLLPLWYLRGYEYNISLFYAGEFRQLNVTVPDPIDPQNPGESWRDSFNYTLNGKSNFTIEPNLAGAVYQLRFNNIELVDTVIWGNNFSVRVNFTSTEDDWATSDPVTLPATVTCYIKSTGPSSSIVAVKSLVFEGNGMFNTTFNSSILSAGGSGELYSIIISGSKPSYSTPSNLTDIIFVDSVQTTLSMHDYYNSLNVISTDSQIYGEALNLTFSFYNISLLKGATLTYEWLSFDPIQFYGDPINDGYYTTSIDTSLAGTWGTKSIKIVAALENYTTQTFFTSISITERQTLLNGSDSVIFLSKSVFALETEYIEFNYTDVLNSTMIANPEEKSYNWQKLDEYGDPIPGENKIGTLNETIDHRFILDLDTASMEVGDYFVFITLQKINYELRNVVISLAIEDRLTSVNGSLGPVIINMGEFSNFTYSYNDDLTNTSITNLDTQTWILNGTQSGSGSLGYDSGTEIYYLIGFDTTSLLNGTYTITVTFDKQNYTSQVVVISLIINYVPTDYKTYLTLISQSPSNFLTDITWRDNVTINFNFTSQYLAGPKNLTNPSTIRLQFLDESLSAVGSSINLINYNTSKGIYSYTFNTSQFILIGGESYYMRIYGSKTTPTLFTPPTPLLIFFKVQSVLTDLTVHNYTTGTEFPSYTLTEYWNQTLGLTFYFKELISSAPITNVILTYSWAYGSGQINPDGGKGSGYYSFFFETGNASIVGTYTITILATKQNFSNGIPSPNLIINIINRPTHLRPAEVKGNYNIIFMSERIYGLETEYFEFNYTDAFTFWMIKNATATYNWQKLDEFGDPIPGETQIGTLNETADRYILDLGTASMDVGDYFILITFDKGNYELRSIVFSLIIEDRPTSVNGSTGGPYIVDVVETLNFTYSYNDDLTNTSITNLDTQTWILNGTQPGSGSLGYDSSTEIYYLVGFDTASLPNGIYTITITFDKQNYATKVIVISLVITYIPTDYLSFLALISQSPSNLVTDITWRDNVTIDFNFTIQYQLGPKNLSNPNSIYLQFLDESFSVLGSSINLINYNISKGIYSFTFNTSHFLFIGGESYYMNILASKTLYTPPTPLLIFFKVQSVLTDLTVHNYTTGTEFPSYTLIEYWNQTLGLTFYFKELVSNAPITSATLTYSWAYGSGQINPDGGKGSGYYSFFFETGNASIVGTYTITILAMKQNFSNGIPSPNLIINIINRPTHLRPAEVKGNYNVIFISEKIYALETEYFEFNYTDVFTSWIIKNAIASYNWQKLDEFGDPIQGATQIGSLNETADRYLLDLGTASMDLGDYFILITFDKLNYEVRSIVFSLTIEDRLTSVNGSMGPVIIDWGDSFNFTFSYIDNLTSTSITNLDIGSWVLNGTSSGSDSLGYDSGNEIYFLVGFNTASLLNGTYTITITLDKLNYASQVVVSSLVISYIPIDYRTFLTLISVNPSNLATDITWRDNVTISFNITAQNLPGPINLTNPNTISLQFLDESLIAFGSTINLINHNTSKGIYTYTFNTSQFLLIGGESYYIQISASKTLYAPPTQLLIFFKVETVLTDLTIHNYTTGTEFPSYTLTEYWNQTFGITFYFKELASSAPITSATLTYSWAFGSGQINPEGAKGSGYYSFFFDTGNVTEIGTYIISI
ncbi:hypothetical protein LCGC14_0988530, partial [marine sediment metagenome]